MFLDMSKPTESIACPHPNYSHYRLVAKSVPDLTSRSAPASMTSEPSTSTATVSHSPRDTPTLSPARTRNFNRSKVSRRHRPRTSENRGSSLEAIGRRGYSRSETPMSTDECSPPGAISGTYRRRVYTMPSNRPRIPIDTSECYRLRSFSVTSRGGVVNLGDMLCYRSRSDVNVVTSEGSFGSDLEFFRDRTSSTGSTSKSDIPRYKVLVVGEENVGKSSLVAQFMTSEYLTVRNAIASDSQEEGLPETVVSILLDGEEAELEYKEIKVSQLNDETFYISDAVMVTYSVTDRISFSRAIECLITMKSIVNKQPQKLRPLGPGLCSKAVILVGNKSDLARKRIVTTEEGRSVASKYDIKFIETSVVIHHNVDELLVGALSQVRLKARQASAMSSPSASRFTFKARGFVNRILEKCDIRFRSCDNLHL